MRAVKSRIKLFRLNYIYFPIKPKS